MHLEGTKRRLAIPSAALILGLAVCCGGDGRDGEDDGHDGTDNGGYDGPTGSLSGTVLAPSGDFPVAGALIYLTSADAPEIPDSIHCYECEDMTGMFWTLSSPDGTWHMDNIPGMDWNLVVRKGLFQRQREVTVVAHEHLDVPPSLTTLPGAASADGLDQIPDFAVLLSHPDESHKLLAKFGMAQMSGDNVAWGTESFDVFNDVVSQPGYPPSTELFADQQTLDGYHMIYLPCAANQVGLEFAESRKEMLRSYVSRGGRIYNSCCVAFWIVRPLPGYIDFYGGNDAWRWDIGRLFNTPKSTRGRISDPGLRSWLQVVTPEVDPDEFPFHNGFTRIDALVPTDDGHGVEEDGYWVVPYSWVEGSAGDEYLDSPLMTTYNFDCGKVFYSVYETSPDSGDVITAQEYVLLYILLEVGVCEGDYVIE